MVSKKENTIGTTIARQIKVGSLVSVCVCVYIYIYKLIKLLATFKKIFIH